ncbi:hypothetical protein WR25_11980 [Diploscapter pachys]|uniref:Uncharacterized protein n=1 Tax=Diploscapter pachys TaxID=2018661 RepID=A0A2A2KWS4_9BILA|nr:hypothetical protein WR25_11980 [Diploscapter pachys]
MQRERKKKSDGKQSYVDNLFPANETILWEFTHSVTEKDEKTGDELRKTRRKRNDEETKNGDEKEEREREEKRCNRAEKGKERGRSLNCQIDEKEKEVEKKR